MKMTFRGWTREVYPHHHVVKPLGIDGLLDWSNNHNAIGKVSGLKLSGDFQVEFEFQEGELRNWLKSYIKSSPEAALKLLAEMQAETIIELHQMNN